MQERQGTVDIYTELMLIKKVRSVTLCTQSRRNMGFMSISYCDEIETLNLEEIPFFSGIVPRDLSVAEGP